MQGSAVRHSTYKTNGTAKEQNWRSELHKDNKYRTDEVCTKYKTD